MLKNIIIILIILAILILGQQVYFKNLGKEAYQKATGWGKTIWQKCESYWNKNILHRVTSEIDKRQNIAKQEIKKETKEVGQNIWEKVKNYFIGLFNGIFKQMPQENKL